MGLKVHCDGFQRTNLLECSSLREIEADVNLVFQLKDLMLCKTIFSNNDSKLSLMDLYTVFSYTKCASFLTNDFHNVFINMFEGS